MTSAVYDAGTIKRRRRTRAAVEQLDEQIIAVLAEDHPQSIRHVFYRQTDPRLPEPVEKSDRGYRHVQHRLQELRRNGAVPYGWITDSTRHGYLVHTFDGAGDFLSRVAGLYRADLWAHADTYVEVWTESRSIRRHHRGRLPRTRGEPLSRRRLRQHHACLHGGRDHQRRPPWPRGRDLLHRRPRPRRVLIDACLERELRKHLDDDVDLRFERLAITPEQIKAYDLPTNPRKAGDRRSRHINRTVEAESMPANILRRLLRSEIEALLPAGALAAAKAAERSEREHIKRMAQLYQGDFRG